MPLSLAPQTPLGMLLMLVLLLCRLELKLSLLLLNIVRWHPMLLLGRHWLHTTLWRLMGPSSSTCHWSRATPAGK